MYGIDISNHQRTINLSAGRYDFAIFKATEGVNFKDASFDKFAVQLTKLGKLIGCYHYARPDRRTDMGKDAAILEADWFIKTMEKAGLIGKAILILDWEQDPTDNFQWAKTWLDRVYEITKVKPFIYANTSVIHKKGSSLVTTKYPVWVASWGSNRWETVGNLTYIPNPNIPCEYRIIQYTSKGSYPEFIGNVDLDFTEMGRTEWITACSPNIEDTRPIDPPTEEAIEEMLSEDMKWAINKGLFIGTTEGKYLPKAPLTREQAASVLRRFSNLMYGTLTSEFISHMKEDGYVDTDSIKDK